MGKMIVIMFEDLVGSKKREILKGVGIERPEDMNWDIIPIATLEIEEENKN